MILPLDGPPLDPASETAREWLREELTKSIYDTEPSLWDRFLDWLLDLLQRTGPDAAAPRWLLGLLVAVALGALVALLVRVLRRDVATVAGRTGAVLGEDGLDAQAYRRRARLAASRGDHDAQLLDSYRAIAAAAEERVLLPELPGRTAHEVALELAALFPSAAPALREAAADFDAVRYGQQHRTRADAERVTELDSELEHTRPVAPPMAVR